MKGYFKCNRCGHCWMISGSSFSTGACDKFGSESVDCEIGTDKAPEWFKPGFIGKFWSKK